MKKLVSVLLATVLLLACIPMTAVDVSAAVTSGTTGDCIWALDDTHLTISGNGAMGDYDFWENPAPWGYHIQSVTIEDGVTTIGSRAFDFCTALTSVVIPDSVTIIGESAFDECTALTSVVIPDSITTIGAYAFNLCTSLTSVIIPDSVITIGYSAFRSCTSLSNIDVAENNDYYSSVDGVLFDKNKTILITYPAGKSGDYTIPDSVTTIGERAFICCESLTSVTISDSVTTIEEGAFECCDSLTSVAIPDSVTTLGNYSFGGCTSLISVTIPDSITIIGAYAFSSCAYLPSVVLPDSITTIGTGAFSYCPNLRSVTIGYSVTTIEECAFEGCFNLNDIYYGGTEVDKANMTIGFNNDNLLGAKWHCTVTSGTTGDCMWALDDTHLTISGNGAMGDYDYYYSENPAPWGSTITKVTIEDGVTTIGNWAFYSCESLTSVTIGDSVTTIGNWAFYDCYSLTSVTIPDSVTTIGDSAFSECYSLTTMTIGDSVTTICEGAFSSCNSLTSVTIPDGVTSIGGYAFYNCDSLTSVTIPDSVTTIGYYAFCYCDSLTSITIPDSVTNIGEYAFYSCKSLTDVYYNGTQADRENISIEDGNGYLLNATWHYKVCEHTWTPATCTAPKTCTVCKATTGKALGHTYTNACDKTCNRSGCGYKRPVGPHKYTSELCDKDCNVCGATRKPAHLYTDSCDIDCNLCRAKRKITHTFSNNCDEYCNVCGEWREAQPHKYSHRCDRDCDECALIRTVTHKYSNKCDSICNYCGSKRKVAAHVYKSAVGKAATLTANGYTIKTCTNCKKTTGDKTVIRKVGHVKLSATAYTYNGSAKKPTVTVKDSMGNKIATSNYTVTYATGRKNVGAYKVTVKFKGNYSGTKTLTFKINPAGTKVSKVTAGTKKLTINVAKKTAQVTGYEIQYATNKSFKSAKTKTLSSYKKTSLSLTGLKAKTTYYIRVRTYKVVSGKKVYSAWSAVKTAKTK